MSGLAAPPLLAIEGLSTHFNTPDGVLRAVDDLSLTIGAGETLGILGESGSGKSMTAMSIMRLIDARPGIVAGSIRLEGRELQTLDESEMRTVRGGRIGMIFQEPMTSLNPVLTIGRQLIETIRLDPGVGATAARARAIELLRLARIGDPERRLDDYPHRFSGGMRQRVMIALALARSPRLLIADEPTTALDVTVQAQILDLLLDLRERLGMAIALITHDFGVVAETCDRVIVMYAGRKVEEGRVADVFAHPLHPYTRALMRSAPKLGGAGERLAEIPGAPPRPLGARAGCPFAPRCGLAEDHCRRTDPEWRDIGEGRGVACWRADGAASHG